MLNNSLQRNRQIERTRLIEELNQAIHTRLGLVIARSGYGKTILLEQFAEHCPIPIVRQMLWRSDRDVLNLHRHSALALTHVLPDMQQIAAILHNRAHESAIQIVNALREDLVDDFVYVLDDLHHIVSSPEAITWLDTFIEFMPDSCHLILVGHELRRLNITKTIASHHIIAINHDHLAFTTKETYELGAIFNNEWSMHDAERLTQRLNGWPAGIMMAVQPSAAAVKELLAEIHTPEQQFELLADALLNTLPVELQEFLITSSILPLLTPELCDNILDTKRSSTLLATILERNLFISHVSSGLVYHQLFREFLQKCLRRDPRRFAALHRRAAAWFAEDNKIDQAVEHYFCAGDMTNLAELIERTAPNYFATGRAQILLDWFELLQGLNVATPRLALHCATVHLARYNFNITETLLMTAERGFITQGNTSELSDVKLRRVALLNAQGRYKAAVKTATNALNDPHLSDNHRAALLNAIGNAQNGLEEYAAAIETLQQALALCQKQAGIHLKATVLHDLGRAYALNGQAQTATTYFLQTLQLQREIGAVEELALALNNLGYHYLRHGEYALADEALQEGHSLVSNGFYRRAEAYLHSSSGDLRRDQGQFDQAYILYEHALECVQQKEPYLRCVVLNNFALLSLWQALPEQAHFYAQSANELAAKSSYNGEGLLAQTILTVCTQNSDGNQKLTSLDNLAAISLTHQHAPIILGLVAQAALQVGDEARSAQYLTQAFELVAHGISLQPLAVLIANTPQLNAFVWRSKLKYKTLLDLINRIPRPATATTREQQPDTLPVFSLRVKILGDIEITRDGREVNFETRKAAELFLHLLLFGKQSRETLETALWPDAAPKNAQYNVYAAIRRARRVLGTNTLLWSEGQFMINPEVVVWCDALVFTEIMQDTARFSATNPGTEIAWRKALNLYRGEFLQGWLEEWLVEQREIYIQHYLQALLGLAECIRARHAYAEAITFFEKAVRLEPYREDIHRAIMGCYANMGEPGKIRTQFQRLIQILEEINVEPSEITIKYVNELLSAG